MILQFNELLNSPFFTENKRTYNPDTGELSSNRQTLIDCSDANPSYLNIASHVQSNKELFEGEQGLMYFMPHLYFQLQYNKDEFLPTIFRNLLIQQWIEVKRSVTGLLTQYSIDKREDVKIIRTRLIIQEPGVYLAYHRHFCKNTLTFCYQYAKNDAEPSYIRFAHRKLDTNAYSKSYMDVPYPSHEKIFFNFKNDPWHGTLTNSWNFNWIHDLDANITIPNTYGGFIKHDFAIFDNDNLSNLQ